MQQSKKSNRHRRVYLIGPGGIKCPCCYPGKNARKVYERGWKKTWRRLVDNEE
jgi:hypothetical protein